MKTDFSIDIICLGTKAWSEKLGICEQGTVTAVDLIMHADIDYWRTKTTIHLGYEQM